MNGLSLLAIGLVLLAVVALVTVALALGGGR